MARNKTTFGPEYSEAEQHAALELMATIGWNKAARHLGISKSTLHSWTLKHPELWSDLRAGDRSVQKRRIAQNLEDLADSYSALEFEALDRAEKLIKTADPKELAALIKAFGSSRGVATVGARGYRGEDAQQVEHTIDFPALEAAANAILERANADSRPLLVENLADANADS